MPLSCKSGEESICSIEFDEAQWDELRALNAAEDGQAGIQQLGGDATMLFYQSEEGNEGREAYLSGRRPDFSRFPRLP